MDDVPINQIPEIEYAIQLESEVESPVNEAYAFIRSVKNNSTRLVLVGSEIEGSYEQNGGECAFPPVSRPMQIRGNEIPARIVEAHTEIWRHLASLDLTEFPLTVVSGIRPCRSDGPKVDITELVGKILVANYGWGGVGWTLAPGAAVKVASLLQDCEVVSPTKGIDLAGSRNSPCVGAMSAAFGVANHKK